jgi:hypothetical protein
MASRSPPPSKRGRREDDDHKSRRWKKLMKWKKPAAKDADEEPLFDHTKFTVELLSEDHVWFEDRWMVTSWCDE